MALASTYTISLYPTTIVFSPEDKEIGRFSGMVPPAAYMLELSSILAPEPVVPAAPALIYRVQTGVFSSLANVETERAKLLNKYKIDTEVVKISQNEKTLYKVQAGPFESREAAESFRQHFYLTEKRNCFITESKP
jgi:cell division septation protein DedD